ncbi:MAG: hypothetical protein ACK44A_00115 [Roseateles sp.]
MQPQQTPASPFSTRPLPALLAELGTSAQGLTTAAAAERRAVHDPLVLLLLGASALSALLGDVASFAVIAVIVAGSVTLDFVQEHRAGQAAIRISETHCRRPVERPGTNCRQCALCKILRSSGCRRSLSKPWATISASLCRSSSPPTQLAAGCVGLPML